MGLNFVIVDLRATPAHFCSVVAEISAAIAHYGRPQRACDDRQGMLCRIVPGLLADAAFPTPRRPVSDWQHIPVNRTQYIGSWLTACTQSLQYFGQAGTGTGGLMLRTAGCVIHKELGASGETTGTPGDRLLLQHQLVGGNCTRCSFTLLRLAQLHTMLGLGCTRSNGLWVITLGCGDLPIAWALPLLAPRHIHWQYTSFFNVLAVVCWSPSLHTLFTLSLSSLTAAYTVCTLIDSPRPARPAPPRPTPPLTIHPSLQPSSQCIYPPRTKVELIRYLYL